MADVDVEATPIYRKLVDNLLNRAEHAKPDKQIEPPLAEAQLGESIWQIHGDDAQMVDRLSQQTQFAAVEIAFREKFYHVLVWDCPPFPCRITQNIADYGSPLRQQHRLMIPPLFKFGIYSILCLFSPTMVRQ